MISGLRIILGPVVIWKRSGSARGKFRFAADMMIECIRLCSFLRGGSHKLAEVVQRSLRIALPHELMGYGEVRAGEEHWCGTRLPSASTILRNEMTLDVAIMLNERERRRLNWLKLSQHRLLVPVCLFEH